MKALITLFSLSFLLVSSAVLSEDGPDGDCVDCTAKLDGTPHLPVGVKTVVETTTTAANKDGEKKVVKKETVRVRNLFVMDKNFRAKNKLYYRVRYYTPSCRIKKIDAEWKLGEKKGNVKQKLSSDDKKKGLAPKVKKKNTDKKWAFTIKAINKGPLKGKKVIVSTFPETKNGVTKCNARATFAWKGEDVILDRVYAHINMAAFWNPLRYIKIHGRNAKSGEKLSPPIKIDN